MAFFITNSKSKILEERDKKAFDDITMFSQATTFFCVSLCYHRNDMLLHEVFTEFVLCIINSVSIKGTQSALSDTSTIIQNP